MPLEPSRALLAGRTALVTGAAAGLGEAIALAFAHFGADVALCDRDAEGLARVSQAVEACGRRAWSGAFDVRDSLASGGFVDRVAEDAGQLDVLVNNAGGTFAAEFLEVSAGGRDALVDVNFTSAAELIRRTVPHVPGSGGSIINITSIEAHRAAPRYALYAAMKAALESLSMSLALELGGRRIRVNCIAPDVIATPGAGSRFPPTPLARKGTPDDVAGAALYLASDLSAFVTGSTLHVDGGNRAAGGWRRTQDGGFALE